MNLTEPVLRMIGVTQQYGEGETAVSALSGVDLE
jgi:putative ABC transport system ATP-binding protein